MSQSNYNKGNIFNSFLYMNSYEFTLLATLIGFLLASKLPSKNQQSLGNFFEQLGQTLLTVSSQNFVLNDETSNMINNLEDLVKKNINDIDEIINFIKNL